MQKSDQQGSKAIVLVHGGFVDGSGWAGVYNILRQKRYNVAVSVSRVYSAGRRIDPRS